MVPNGSRKISRVRLQFNSANYLFKLRVMSFASEQGCAYFLRLIDWCRFLLLFSFLVFSLMYNLFSNTLTKGE